MNILRIVFSRRFVSVDLLFEFIFVLLRKRIKTIVIATHNANIAVRSLPYTSIFRTHQNGKYNTYVGNPFNNLLVNIDDATDVKGWAQESMLQTTERIYINRRKTAKETTINALDSAINLNIA